jgi:hypothetical protein
MVQWKFENFLQNSSKFKHVVFKMDENFTQLIFELMTFKSRNTIKLYTKTLNLWISKGVKSSITIYHTYHTQFLNEFGIYHKNNHEDSNQNL